MAKGKKTTKKKAAKRPAIENAKGAKRQAKAKPGAATITHANKEAKPKPVPTNPVSQSVLASIPSMTALLSAAASLPALASQSQSVVTNVLREIVSGIRDRVRSGPIAGMDFSLGAILDATVSHLRSRGTRRLSRVINATGIVLHTGLGRSVLPDEAVARLAKVASGYCGLEIDLETGDRGLRGGYVEELLRELTGAETALVVNNNAAATMLALRALAQGREVIVSRGQLIEIGGSYRLPEVMSAGGATLREVGTTNKTHLRDYERAINERTGLIMHVHTSNYRVVGFSESPTAAQLAKLAHDRKLPMFDDLGSGALMDDDLWRSANEPTVAASLRAGADVIGFSGDKLLGGPQAGILLGRRDTIERLRKDPMARALRVGKLTMAALEAVLELYQDPAAAKRRIPLLARLSESEASLMQRAEALASLLGTACPGERFEVRTDESFAGGGSLPAFPFPTATVRWVPTKGSLDGIARALRLSEPAVLARLNEGAIVFDVRAMKDEEFGEVVGAVLRAISGSH